MLAHTVTEWKTEAGSEGHFTGRQEVKTLHGDSLSLLGFSDYKNEKENFPQ